MKSYKVYIDSAAWVCEPNLVDTSRIYRYMIENGHKITSNSSKADFVIINSCGLCKSSIDRSVNLFEKYYSEKQKNSSIILFGCLIKINPKLIGTLDIYPIDFNEGYKFDEIFYKKIKFENINPYCDDKTKNELLCNKNPHESPGKPIFRYQLTRIIPFILSGLIFPFSKKVKVNHKKMIDSVTYENKNFIEIARGCTGNCSYCTIKKAIGNVCSRKVQDIISDIEKLYDPSKILFLVADDCGCYGMDIKTNLFNLLYEINKKFPDLLIELNYIYPYWLVRYPDEYIKLFKDVKINLASIPVQSGSNKVLKSMNRNYDINKVINVLGKLKEVSPITITYSHFIIGFPGENTVDFLKTLYCAIHFDFPMAFGYSESIDTTSKSLLYHKSKFTISVRLALFLVIMNLIIFYKLLSNPK